jgi:8-oxo-dGTP diphosphatase
MFHMKLFVGAKGVVHYDGKVLLIRESAAYLDGSEEGRWDMVGGRIEPDEDVRIGLVREIKEESGLMVVPKDLLGVFDGYPTIRGEVCHVVRLYFLCEAESDQVVLSEDHDTFVWVDPVHPESYPLMDDIAEMLTVAHRRLSDSSM